MRICILLSIAFLAVTRYAFSQSSVRINLYESWFTNGDFREQKEFKLSVPLLCNQDTMMLIRDSAYIVHVDTCSWKMQYSISIVKKGFQDSITIVMPSAFAQNRSLSDLTGDADSTMTVVTGELDHMILLLHKSSTTPFASITTKPSGARHAVLHAYYAYQYSLAVDPPYGHMTIIFTEKIPVN